MAYPTLVGTASGVSGTVDTFHSFPTLPGGSAGDLLLAIFLCTGSESLTISGYTTLFTGPSDTSDLTVIIAYKTASGSEFAPTVATSSPCDSVAMVRRFSGWTGVQVGTDNTGRTNPAIVSSHTVSGSADRIWVSIVGATGDKTSATTPGLSNEVSVTNSPSLTILSGTSSTTSNTVALGSYSLGSIVDWITDSVIVSGTGGTTNTLSINATLSPVVPYIVLEEQHELNAAITIGEIGSYINLIAYPDYTAHVGEFGFSADMYVAYPVSIGELIGELQLLTYKATARCKVWVGSAWVSAPPKIWDGSAWVEAFDVKVFLAGSWIRLS